MAVGDQAISEIQRIIQSVPGAMFEVGRVVAETIRSRVRTKYTGPQGPLAPYSERYAARKRRPRNAVNLTDTGEYLDSIGVLNGDGTRFDPRGRGSQFRGQPGNAGQFVSARDVEIQIGPQGPRNQKIGGILTAGNQARNLPSRPHIGLTEQEQDELAQVLSRSLYQAGGTTENINLNITLG